MSLAESSTRVGTPSNSRTSSEDGGELKRSGDTAANACETGTGTDWTVGMPPDDQDPGTPAASTSGISTPDNSDVAIPPASAARKMTRRASPRPDSPNIERAAPQYTTRTQTIGGTYFFVAGLCQTVSTAIQHANLSEHRENGVQCESARASTYAARIPSECSVDRLAPGNSTMWIADVNLILGVAQFFTGMYVLLSLFCRQRRTD